MSREALSLDISHVVSRVVRGEPIDPSEKGAALAAKYPDLGMSAELIGAAITRAAGMVGRIREEPVAKARPPRPAPVPPVTTPKANGVERVRASAPLNGSTHGSAKGGAKGSVSSGLNGGTPPLSSSIDEALANAIDAEIGALVTGQAAQHKRQENGDDSPAAGHSASTDGVGARLRRAFFRH